MLRQLPWTINRRLQIADLIVFGVIGLFIYGMIVTAQRWQSVYQPVPQISLSINALPLYSLYSAYRAFASYCLSMIFALTLGYLAAKNRIAEMIIVPLLDVGQSIPVLGFLPGLVLGLVALFPNTNIGLELACVLMIFTSQCWNLAFSFISSLKGIPTQLTEMTANVGLNRSQRLIRLELPSAATGLAWNSLISIAGGWFFLTVCESFTLGDRNFRLPGLGSYMALAIETGNAKAMVAGVTAMFLIILVLDFLVWRPIIAWTGKFRLSESAIPEADDAEIPFMALLLKGSPVFEKIADYFTGILGAIIELRRPKLEVPHAAKVISRFIARKPEGKRRRLGRIGRWFRTLDTSRFARGLLLGALSVAGFLIVGKVYRLVESVRWVVWREILISTGLTFVRVTAAMTIAAIWAIPLGVWIGRSQKLTRIFQPVIQLIASFPAPMIFPLALAVLGKMGFSLGYSSIILMLLGIQWYVLFNVLDGAVGISQELRETYKMIGVSPRGHWWTLYLPSIFPSLVTGLVTAFGGAWNASIVSEFVILNGQTMRTQGLGAMITDATASGDFAKLAACLIVMIVTVVTFNRTVWFRLFSLAESRYRFER